MIEALHKKIVANYSNYWKSLDCKLLCWASPFTNCKHAVDTMNKLSRHKATNINNARTSH